MEGFTYVDIFSTKGLEYLLVLAGLLTFSLFLRFLKRPVALVSRGAGQLVSAIGDWFRAPAAGVYLHQGHAWAAPEAGAIVRVGVDDFAQKMVGRVDAIELPQIGAEVVQGETGWRLIAGAKAIEMLSPVDGRIVEINEALLAAPERVGEDPYGRFWLMKVETPRLASNLKNLLSGTIAKRWMDEVRERLLARMDYRLGAVYQDGGVPVDGIARSLDQERWDEIVREFFLTS